MFLGFHCEYKYSINKILLTYQKLFKILNLEHWNTFIYNFCKNSCLGIAASENYSIISEIHTKPQNV